MEQSEQDEQRVVHGGAVGRRYRRGGGAVGSRGAGGLFLATAWLALALFDGWPVVVLVDYILVLGPVAFGVEIICPCARILPFLWGVWLVSTPSRIRTCDLRIRSLRFC